jgi:AraC family transcriptional regulator
LNTTTADRYLDRFRQVLRFIDTHLDEELTVESLASVAAFSKYHFHRQFSELFGIGVYRYVQQLRLKRASHQLAFRGDSILDIALQNGYESPEAFSRAFKKALGQSPSAFREQPQWETWHANQQVTSELRRQHMKPQTGFEDIRIVNFPETRIAVLEHHGAPQRIGDTVRKFIEWRKLNHLPPRISATYNLLYHDPDQVAAQDFRMDICAATDKDIAPNEHGVIAKTIPAGRCAVLRHTGSDDTLSATVHLLYAEWLPQSGEELRDFPLFFQRVKFFPDVAEHEAVTDVFLPLKG